ncbi:uncharacterized protein LOC112603731 [Melanaphis sacchari]|uniref:uncharacterized protein LOC112603731 n=1 Tax=Melanaphis sacchari TaxID=742174 RepID=UPI000DC13900|nr:uncharacterized protein LOC112603731 [Melanaphis sacchari]
MFTEVKVKMLTNENDQVRDIEMNNSELNGKLDDPGYWPSIISNDIIATIVTLGPIQINNYDFPQNDEKPARTFTEKYYYRLMPNGENVNRPWLIYSKRHNCVYCFCFIDKAYLALIEKEKLHWRSVLKRILAAIHFLAQHNDSFRGSSDKLYTEKNGKFLGLIEMMEKFDPIISEHVRRIKCKETFDHYLGPEIQNELNAKYYSVLIDCTPDISHKEQVSIMLRIVNLHTENQSIEPCVEEYFLEFIHCTSTTGLNLSNILISKLAEYKIELRDCRGQGYDNGANMKGEYQGVQSRIKQKNPRAFFTPCATHNLNLLLGDIAKSSVKAISFFWSDSKNLLWECRVNSVKAIRFQISEVIEALEEVSETTNDPKTKYEAHSLVVNELESYEFILSLVIWYEILVEVNIVSKHLQSENIDLEIGTKLLDGLMTFLENYRENGFEKAKKTAREIALSINIECTFKIKRVRKTKTFFEYEETKDKNTNDAELDLQILLTDGSSRDLDSVDMYSELIIFRNIIDDNTTVLQALTLIKKSPGSFQNISIALRILLTIPVTSAGVERSFSKLKLIKTYLRSTMSQNRLNSLATISIEHKLAVSEEYNSLIDEFASKKSRIKRFN